MTTARPVTFALNHWDTLNSRTPSFRFGTGHIYNNYFDTLLDSGVDSRDGAQTLVELNVFLNADNPIETTLNGGLYVLSHESWKKGF